MQTKFRPLLSVVPVIFASFLATGTAEAVQFTFNPDGVDTTYSLGQFKILVDASFGGGTYISPVLFDNNTQIQHTLDTGNPNHVITQVLHFDMQGGGGTHLTAGSAAATGTSSSLGDVVSTNSNGTFPASSIFNMYVNALDAGLPAGSFLYNPTGTPLQIASPVDINSFPPDIVYIHGSSSAVPVYLHNVGSSTDFLFGYLTLAGHGVLDVCHDPVGQCTIAQDLGQFQAMFPAFYNNFTSTIAALTDAPINTNDPRSINSQFVVPEPSTLALFGAGLILFGYSRRRKAA